MVEEGCPCGGLTFDNEGGSVSALLGIGSNGTVLVGIGGGESTGAAGGAVLTGGNGTVLMGADGDDSTTGSSMPFESTGQT